MNKKIAWTLVIIWMLLIFFFSSQVATDSNGMSTGLTVAIRNLIIQIYPKLSISIETLNHFIRKSAHFLVYFGLGFLLKNAYQVSGYLNFRGSVYALMVSILYAISDEIHQMFVPGRGPGIKDVFIDSIGALAGILVFTGLLKVSLQLKNAFNQS
jgi:VanZ family protein